MKNIIKYGLLVCFLIINISFAYEWQIMFKNGLILNVDKVFDLGDKIKITLNNKQFIIDKSNLLYYRERIEVKNNANIVRINLPDPASLLTKEYAEKKSKIYTVYDKDFYCEKILPNFSTILKSDIVKRLYLKSVISDKYRKFVYSWEPKFYDYFNFKVEAYLNGKKLEYDANTYEESLSQVFKYFPKAKVVSFSINGLDEGVKLFLSQDYKSKPRKFKFMRYYITMPNSRISGYKEFNNLESKLLVSKKLPQKLVKVYIPTLLKKYINFEKKEEGNFIAYKFTSKHIPTLQEDEDMPGIYSSAFAVITIGDFKRELSKWYENLKKNYLNLPLTKEEKKFIKTNRGKSLEEIITAFLLPRRFLPYKHESFDPYPVKEFLNLVWRDNYLVKLESVVALFRVLKAMGFDVRFEIGVDSKSVPQINAGVNFESLNFYLKVNNNYVYPIYNWLMVSKRKIYPYRWNFESKKFEKQHYLKNVDNLLIKLNFVNDQVAVVDYVVRENGTSAVLNNKRFISMDERVKKILMQRWAVSEFRNALLKNYKISNCKTTADKFNMRLKVLVFGLLNKINKKYYELKLPRWETSLLPFSKKRNFPFIFDTSKQISKSKVIINLPTGFKVVSLPKDYSIKIKNLSFTRKVKLLNNKVIIEKIKKQEKIKIMNPKDFSKFLDKYNNYLLMENQGIILEKVK